MAEAMRAEVEDIHIECNPSAPRRGSFEVTLIHATGDGDTEGISSSCTWGKTLIFHEINHQDIYLEQFCCFTILRSFSGAYSVTGSLFFG